MTLSVFRQQFQSLFATYVREKSQANARLADDAFIGDLIRYTERLVGEGKRIRPYLTWTMYEACSGTSTDAIIRLTMALELFHVFALVHDDVMDRGTSRHGVPTVHVAARDRLQEDRRAGDIVHAADGHAILIGDLLAQWSQDVFFSTPGIDEEARQRAAPYFSQMIEEVIVGQMIDLDLTTRSDVTRGLIERKMALKTSGYTFIRPMQIGAALAGAPLSTIEWCVAFGTALGRAFQIQDDLLDLMTPSTETGKTAFSDLQERQHTLFTQYIREQGSDEQRGELDALFGAKLTEEDRPRVTALLERSGALTNGRTEIASSLQEALDLLDRAPINGAAQASLRSFVDEMRSRQA
jgi:geranylgeranyl diphosphate synthase type I